MEIKQHEYVRSVLGSQGDLNTVKNALGNMYELIHSLEDLTQTTSTSPDDYMYVDLSVDTDLSTYVDCGCSVQGPVVMILQNALSNTEELNEAVDEILAAGMTNQAVTADDVQRINNIAESALQGFATAIYFDFIKPHGLDGIDQCIKDLADSKAMKPEDLLRELATAYKDHRKSLGYFIDHPDQEDDFLDKIGAAIVLINEDQINEKFVDRLLRDEITEEDIIDTYQQMLAGETNDVDKDIAKVIEAMVTYSNEFGRFEDLED